jgi:hypothetical protein
MITAHFDPTEGVLRLVAAGKVDVEQMTAGVRDVEKALATAKPGFRLLTDLSAVESMPAAAAADVGHIMDLCDRHGVDSVVRVLPREPQNDIGFAILTPFHYSREVRIITCDNRGEAERVLAEPAA